MPENPFGGVGSRGEQRAMQASARAVRAYSTQLKRLLGMEQAVGDAAEARALAASRAIGEQNKAIGRTSSLLDDQGKALRNLDQVRQRYHDAELKRTKSLAYHYEKAKQFLVELRQDTDDTSTVLGTFTRGWKSGIDNMLRFGKLPQASQQIRDVRVDVNDLSGTLGDAAGAAGDLGAGMAEQFPRINQYRSAMVDLDDAMIALSSRYNMNEEAARKLGGTIVSMAAIDIGGGEGAIAQVSKLADQLTVLNTIAGVTAEQGMQFAIERAQQVGGSMEDALEDVENFSAMADIMRERLKNVGLTKFSYTIREEFVKSMMEARRMLKGQVVDLENVGAAFQWAAEKAIKYGASAESAGKFAQAFGKMMFKQDISAETMLSGQRLQGQLQSAMKKFRQERGIEATYEQMSEDQRKAAQEFVARQMGIRGEGEGGALTREQRRDVQHAIKMRGRGGFAPAQIQAMLGTSEGGMRSMLQTQQRLFGGVDASTLSELLKQRYGLDVDTGTAIDIAEQIRGGDIDAAVEEIKALREQAEEQATEADPRAALTAVMAMKDPVQELFNIKNLLKVLVLNVDNILGLISRIPGVGGAVGRIREYTRGILGEQTGEERKKAEERAERLEENRTKLQERVERAQARLAEAGSEGARERIGEQISRLQEQLQENAEAQQGNNEILGQIAEEERIAGGGREEAPAEEATEGTGVISSALRTLTGGGGGPTAALSPLLGALLPTGGPPAGGGEEGPGILGSLVRAVTPGPGSILSAAVAPGASVLSSIFGGGGETQRRPQLGPGAATQRARASLGPSPEGAMEAAGEGDVTVGADGRSVMSVRMVIENMEEVVAHAQSQTGGINNFFS